MAKLHLFKTFQSDFHLTDSRSLTRITNTALQNKFPMDILNSAWTSRENTLVFIKSDSEVVFCFAEWDLS